MGETNSSRRGRRLSYANVMSTLAVFLVLAGGTALATGLRRNSVVSRTVKDNSLQSADLKDGSGVSGADVAPGSLKGIDVAPGSLGGADVADGSLTGADVANGSIAGADIGQGAVGASNLAAGAVNSSAVVDGSIQAADLGIGSVTGRNVNESTLSQVPNALKLNGRPASAYVRNFLFEPPTPAQRGTDLQNGAFEITQSCPTGDVLVSGGPDLVDAGSTLVASFPTRDAWTVRINPHGLLDEFRVRVVCARLVP